MKTNTLLNTLSDYFTSYLPDVKGLSRNSITTYQYAFQLLFDFLYEEKALPPERVTFKTLTYEIILEYLLWLETKRNCSPITRNSRLSAISSFAKYALRKNFNEALQFHSDVVEIPQKRTPKNPDIKYFTKEEIAIILNAPNTKTTIGKRDVMILSLLYASGARAQELCDLTLNDVCFGNETNIRLTGKGNKSRLVTIPLSCAGLLKNYIKSRNMSLTNSNDGLRYIFSSQVNEKMSVSCVEEIVKKYVTKVKISHPNLFKRKSYSPHSFRHSIAVHMLECGESLVVIKAFLGHSSIMTTTVYANVTPELANKYLRERGKALEHLKLDGRSIEHQNVGMLSFLGKRYYGKRTGDQFLSE